MKNKQKMKMANLNNTNMEREKKHLKVKQYTRPRQKGLPEPQQASRWFSNIANSSKPV